MFTIDKRFYLNIFTVVSVDDGAGTSEPEPTPEPIFQSIEVLEVLGTEEEIVINRNLYNFNALLLSFLSAITNNIPNLIIGENMTSNDYLSNTQALLKSLNDVLGGQSPNLITGDNLSCTNLFANNIELLKQSCTVFGATIPTLRG